MDVKAAFYWDASAILSALFEDNHSPSVMWALENRRNHLISSLGWSEVHSVMQRMLRDGGISRAWHAAAFEALSSGTWTRILAVPDWILTKDLASRWSLTGADLWHLALVKTLQRDLPELRMITYDLKLKNAAAGEGFDVDL